jgi:hypothetical protein
MVIKTSDPLTTDTVPHTTKCFICNGKCVNKTPMIYNLLILIYLHTTTKIKTYIQTCEVDFHRAVYSKIKCRKHSNLKTFCFPAQARQLLFVKSCMVQTACTPIAFLLCNYLNNHKTCRRVSIKRSFHSPSVSNYSPPLHCHEHLDDPWFRSHVGNALRNAAFTAVM